MTTCLRAPVLILTLLGEFMIATEGPVAQPVPRHRLFSELLSTYVHDGSVNYSAMRSDKRLAEYIGWIANTNPDTLPNEKAMLAFWINAYNAYTLKIVCDNYPIESINELHTGGLLIGTVFNLSGA